MAVQQVHLADTSNFRSMHHGSQQVFAPNSTRYQWTFSSPARYVERYVRRLAEHASLAMGSNLTRKHRHVAVHTRPSIYCPNVCRSATSPLFVLVATSRISFPVDACTEPMTVLIPDVLPAFHRAPHIIGKIEKNPSASRNIDTMQRSS